MADPNPDEGLTYAEAGVDIDASTAATDALLAAVGDVVDTEYAGMIEFGDQYLALATDGVGTKLLVAEAVGDYSTIGIDCIAMNVNDLVAAGVRPLAFVDYLAIDEPSEKLTADIGAGLAAGAEKADIALLGGETAVLPEIVSGFDLAGACVGVAEKQQVLQGSAQPGDRLVGVPASGIHSNGLTLARAAVTQEHAYTDPFPPDPDRSIGEVLLEPTRIYTDLLEPMWDHNVSAAAHITGGGWTNLPRMGDYRYDVTDPYSSPPIFEFIQDCGEIPDAEMHRTFNMGTGFVVAVAEEDAESFAQAVNGRIIGEVTAGSDIAIRGLELD